jgi:hypothetical protein
MYIFDELKQIGFFFVGNGLGVVLEEMTGIIIFPVEGNGKIGEMRPRSASAVNGNVM